jgi:hypothetical protein
MLTKLTRRPPSSWWALGPGATSVEQFTDYLREARQLVGQDLPDQGIVDDRVPVDQDVPERDDPVKIGDVRGQACVGLGGLLRASPMISN